MLTHSGRRRVDQAPGERHDVPSFDAANMRRADVVAKLAGDQIDADPTDQP
jgi:hypothetical protein